jgi:hypothetical protein
MMHSAVHDRQHRRAWLRTSLAAGMGAWCSRPGGGWLGGSGGKLAADEPTPDELMTDEIRGALQRGWDYLASRQNEDGSFGRGGYSFNVAVVALGGLAWMARGDLPHRGPFARHVQRCTDYILRNCQPSGFIHAPAFTGQGPMYGHGFATMFLAEVYGMTSDKRIRDRLSRAVQLIVQTQNHEGGWRYEPRPHDADISVTICQIMALRAARNAGLYVPTQTVDRCIDFVKRCQNPDGGFMYMLSHVGPSDFPRSAAGVVALYSAGIYEGDEIERGIQYLLGNAPHRQPQFGEAYYYYGQYYAAQAMFQYGGETWRDWYRAVSRQLLQRQKRDGEWFDPICPEYGTAMASIVLQMPSTYLPIFQR